MTNKIHTEVVNASCECSGIKGNAIYGKGCNVVGIQSIDQSKLIDIKGSCDKVIYGDGGSVGRVCQNVFIGNDEIVGYKNDNVSTIALLSIKKCKL